MSLGSTSWIGRTIGDCLRVERRLATGGMGEVYLAEHLRLGIPVVIKSPRRGMLFDDPALGESFQREIRRQLRLNHPHHVKIFDVGEEEGIPYAVLQYLEGGTLETHPERGKAEFLAHWLPQIADALDYIHREGFVHRDVKPGNIFFDAQGNAYLGDFGIIKALAQDRSGKASLRTATGMVLGTPGFIAPEILRSRSLGGRSDQFALAVTAYECLSGKLPFEASTDEALLVQPLVEEPKRLDTQDGRWDRAVGDVLERALAKEPERRYADCMGFARELSRSLGQAEYASRPAGASRTTSAEAAAPNRSTPTVDRSPSRAFVTERQDPADQANGKGPADYAEVFRRWLEPLGRGVGWLQRRRRKVVDEPDLPAGPAPAKPAENGRPELAKAPFDAAEARKHQAAWSRHVGVPVEKTNSIGMRLVLMPAGEFLMGSPEDEAGRDDDEGPQHRVRITRPFYLGATEVTQGQYEKVMGENPSNFKGPTRPVEDVRWKDAVEFCRRLSQKEGREYRLPTEAEWEYACRAGTTTPFHFGSVLNGHKANCHGDFPYRTETKGPDKGETVSVGSYRPNAWGLYDMHGNVWEWCRDWYDEDYYGKSPADDPMGPTAGSYRVFRGGGWGSFARLCRSALRNGITPVYRVSFLGFRVARSPAD